VVGFADEAEASPQAYDLTSMRQDLDAIAAATVDLLLHRREAPERESETVLVPVTLVRRGSARL
jgi:DNA-binding LacI/PurR family transcriptional regulator